MLASDEANPAFIGARDPDAALIVHFYIKPVENPFKTAKEKRPIFEDVIYVRIDVPGVKDMQVDRAAHSGDQKRFPKQYQHFVNMTQGDAREIGTPLTEWPILTRSQAEEFRALKFFTIESVANASDLNINNMGMMGGMSPFALREKARDFLKVAAAQAIPDQLAQVLADNAMLKEQLAKLLPNAAPQETASKPLTAVTAPAGAAPRKRGRPSKADIAARSAQKVA